MTHFNQQGIFSYRSKERRRGGVMSMYVTATSCCSKKSSSSLNLKKFESEPETPKTKNVLRDERTWLTDLAWALNFLVKL